MCHRAHGPCPPDVRVVIPAGTVNWVVSGLSWKAYTASNFHRGSGLDCQHSVGTTPILPYPLMTFTIAISSLSESQIGWIKG